MSKIPTKLRASSIHRCTKCLLKYLQTEPEENQSSQAMLGTIIHAGFLDYFEDLENVKIINREKELEDELFTGHIDGEIESKDTKIVFELKTVSTWTYKLITEPKIEHIQQVCCYSLLGDFEEAKIVYLNRDSGEYKIFDIDLTTNEMNAMKLSLISKAKEVYMLNSEGKTPEDIPFDPFEVCDDYCEFATRPTDNAPSIDDEITDIDMLDNAEELKEWVGEYQMANEREKQAKKEKEQFGNLIKEEMEKGGFREIVGCAIYYQNKRKSFDKKAFEKEEPELLKKYTKTSNSSYFRVKA